MADLVAEIDVRWSLGDVYAGERVAPAVMGILSEIFRTKRQHPVDAECRAERVSG